MLIYETLHAAKEKLIAADITGIGRGNILISTSDEPVGRLMYKYIRIAYAGTEAIGGYGGGCFYRFWHMSVSMHVTLSIQQIYATRRQAEELIKLEREVLKTCHFWYNTPVQYLSGTGLVDASAVSTTTGGIAYLFCQPVEFIVSNGPLVVSVDNNRNEYVLEQVYRVGSKTTNHNEFDL